MTTWRPHNPRNWTDLWDALNEKGEAWREPMPYTPSDVCQSCRESHCWACDGVTRTRERSYSEHKPLAEKPCRCAKQGHPPPVYCTVLCQKQEGLASYEWRCDRPVKASYVDSAGHVHHVCGLHRGVQTRAENRAAAEAEKRRVADEANARAEEEQGAVEETAAMLNAWAEQFGITLKAEVTGGPARWGGRPSPIRLELDTEAGGALARLLWERFSG